MGLTACAGSNDKKKSAEEKAREDRVANAEACSAEFVQAFKAINKTYRDGQRAYDQGNRALAEQSILSLQKQCGEMLGKYDRSAFGCKIKIEKTTDVVDYDGFVQSCKDLGYTGALNVN
jgi:hypothetical protein